MTRFVKRANGPWHWSANCPDYPDGVPLEVHDDVGLPAGAPRCDWCLEHEPALNDRGRRPRRVEPDEGDQAATGFA